MVKIFRDEAERKYERRNTFDVKALQVISFWDETEGKYPGKRRDNYRGRGSHIFPNRRLEKIRRIVVLLKSVWWIPDKASSLYEKSYYYLHPFKNDRWGLVLDSSRPAEQDGATCLYSWFQTRTSGCVPFLEWAEQAGRVTSRGLPALEFCSCFLVAFWNLPNTCDFTVNFWNSVL